MRRYPALAAVATVVLLSMMSAAQAPAATSAVLTYGSAGGAAVAAGDTVTAALAAGTEAAFYSDTTGTSGVTCGASTISATVVSNPAAPGDARESVTAQSFSDCSSDVTGVTGIQSLTTQNLPFSASVNDSDHAVVTTGTATAPIQSTVVLSTFIGSITCVYQATGNTLTGTVPSSGSSVRFTGQRFSLVSGSALCFANVYFSADYGPVVDRTAGGRPVFVN